MSDTNVTEDVAVIFGFIMNSAVTMKYVSVLTVTNVMKNIHSDIIP